MKLNYSYNLLKGNIPGEYYVRTYTNNLYYVS